MKLTTKQKIKLIVAGVIALLLLIVILQNTESVDTKILFITITLPRAVLLFGSMIVGFILGLVAADRIRKG